MAWRSNTAKAAEASLHKGLEFNPQFPTVHYSIALTHLLRNEPEKGLVEAQLEPDRLFRLGALTAVYHALGRKAESDAALRELTEKYTNTNPNMIAACYAYRGEVDQAMRWLEQAYISHDAGLAVMLQTPLLRPLAHDRRYQVFLRKMNLPTHTG